MAVMHPVDIENYDYTPTEKEMYYALKEQLPENQTRQGSHYIWSGCPQASESGFHTKRTLPYCGNGFLGS